MGNTISDDVLPIREISRITGVNTVTLRAWERRYGLIKPQRTHKGHRVYRSDDVALIIQIQQWLARGLSISKVSELLESTPSNSTAIVDNSWLELQNKILQLLCDFNISGIANALQNTYSIYPPEIIADYLLAPILSDLRVPAFGNTLKKSLLTQRALEYLMMLLQRHRQTASLKKIGIIQLSSEENILMLTSLHYGFIVNQMQSELLGCVPVDEVVLAQEKFPLDILVVYNDFAESFSDFEKTLDVLVKKMSIPVVVGGTIAGALMENYASHVHVVKEGTQQAVMQKLQFLSK